jgi:hypothetical protein
VVSDEVTPIVGPLVGGRLGRGLVGGVRGEGVRLVGPGGFLGGLTETVLEWGRGVGMEGQLGYPEHAPEGRDKGDSRNCGRSMAVLSGVGEVVIVVPRDRDGSLEPRVVEQRQRLLSGVDGLVFWLAAWGLSGGGVAARLRRRVRGGGGATRSPGSLIGCCGRWWPGRPAAGRGLPGCVRRRARGQAP